MPAHDITPYIDPEQLATLRDTQPIGKRPLLSFWVEGSPVPKGRPRVVNKKARTPQRTKDWEDCVAWFARYEMAQMQFEYDILTEPVEVQLHFFYGGGTADLDNLIKAVLDALNGVVWQDDVQVNAIHATIQRGISKEWCGVQIIIDPI